MKPIFEKIFGFDPQKHNVRTEMMAGITTFLTMAYILAVNPTIFSALPGMPSGSVFTATALAAIIGTLVMALYAKKPFALAPGMGLNAFFVYTVCLVMGYSWQFALTAVLIEGLIFIILTVTKVRSLLLKAIPGTLNKAIGAGIGLFIAFIGMQNAGIIVNSDATLVTQKMFMADSVATVCGACLGTSTTTTYVESASGVGEGGRTGLTAFSTALCFALPCGFWLSCSSANTFLFRHQE